MQVERFRDFIADNDAKRNRAEMKAQVRFVGDED